MEREVGGGIGMGNTCKPMAVSFQCMTKSTTKKKKLWNIGKAILKGKLGAIKSYLRKQEKSQVNNLSSYLKQLEEEKTKAEVSRTNKIIKIVAETNELETKQLQRSMKLKPGSLKR